MTSGRKKIFDAARLLGAQINNDLDEAILNAAIDEMDPQHYSDPNESEAMNMALNAVVDAKQTLTSTQETCAEVKRTERKNSQ